VVPHASEVDGEALSQIRRVTLAGLAIDLGLAAGKSTTGMLVKSQALVADGVHSLSDCVTDLAVLIGVRFWSDPPDEDHPHGHGRIETVISFLIGLTLGGVAFGITWNALESISRGESRIPGWPAFWVALTSIALKESIYRWTARVGRRVKSSAVIANAWHHRSDALSSLPVALSVVVGRLFPQVPFLDQIAALIVSVFLFKAAGNIAIPSLKTLIDSAADREVRERIREKVRATDGVRSLHALRTRHIGSGLSVDLHIQVDAEITVREGHDIAGLVEKRLLQSELTIADVLVHVEPFEEE
jgi:cation diffusion facilitator family transporter